MRRRAFITLLVSAAFAMPWAACAEPAGAMGSVAARLVGTWTFRSSINTRNDGSTFDRWGANPKGTFMFDSGGHFVEVIMGSESRFFGAKSFFAFGTYSVDEAQKIITTRIEGSSNAKLTGTEQQRVVTMLTESMLSYVNLRSSLGTKVEAVWQRLK